MRAILTWHSIDPSGSPISVTALEFAQQLAWLEESGVRVVKLAELMTLPAETDAAALTFDDGLESVAAEAAPLLAERGWSATVFVVTTRAGLDNRWPGAGRSLVFPLLDWDALGRLQERGWEIGSHTRSHPRLSACEDSVLVDEIEGAAEDIAARFGRRPEAFAYPYGDLDARCAARVAAAYRWGCTTDHRPLGTGEDNALLPRLDAGYLRGAALRRRWGTPAFGRWLGWRRTLRAIRRAVT